MTTALELADAVGRKQISDALGVGLTAVSNAVVRGAFPSSWFLVVKSLAEKGGHSCPPELFNMRSVNPPSVNASPARQPAPGKTAHNDRVAG